MAAIVRITIAIACTMLVAGCGPTHGASAGGVLTDVVGRGLQPAWWVVLPTPEPVPDEPGVSNTPRPLVLPGDALFDVATATLRPEDIDELVTFGQALATQDASYDQTWLVVGATDSTGEPATNYQLGLDRAVAVIEVLDSIPALDRTRFDARSWGEACPAVDETEAPDVDEARAMNRRVVLIPEGTAPQCPVSPSDHASPTKGDTPS